jgi:membrane-associated phospholipid phosphatase
MTSVWFASLVVDRRRRIALAFLAGFGLVSALVLGHVTRSLDIAVRNRFLTASTSTALLRAADRFIDDARPSHTGLVLVVASLGVAIGRRSWRPLAYAGLIGALAAAPAELLKLTWERPNPLGLVPTHDGSYPSGHTLTILVALGGSLLLLRPRTRWWQWLIVAAAGIAMAVAMLLVSGHWITDLAGSALLAVAVLTFTSTSTLRPGRRLG